MQNNMIKKVIEDTNEYLSHLNLALNIVTKSDIDRKGGALYVDGLIKRFETMFYKTTNLLRLSLIQEGIHTISPRQSLQEAARLSWINDFDFWMQALDARASTINGASDLTNNEYINLITQFAVEVEVITNLLSELKSGGQPSK